MYYNFETYLLVLFYHALYYLLNHFISSGLSSFNAAESYSMFLWSKKSHAISKKVNPIRGLNLCGTE